MFSSPFLIRSKDVKIEDIEKCANQSINTDSYPRVMIFLIVLYPEMVYCVDYIYESLIKYKFY